MIILADNNLRGAVRALCRLLECEWTEYVAAYNLRFLQLEDVGLNARSPDADIYLKCMQIDAILVTSDKTTNDGANSLENVIQRFGRKESPPVITISNQVKVLKDPDYQRQCACDLLDCISDIENYRGIGRVYIPFQWPGGRH